MTIRPSARRGVAAVLLAGSVLAAAACTTSAPAAAPGGDDMSDMLGMSTIAAPPTTPALPAAEPTGTGLSSSFHGYTFVPADETVSSGLPSMFSFHIDGPDGRAVTRYQPYESQLVVFEVIRSDLTEYHYLGTAMRQDGTWSAQLPPLPTGTYRAFVTFAAPDSSHGTPLVYQLSHTFTVPGAASQAPIPPPTTTATTGGYTVSLTGQAVAGTPSALAVKVTKDGKPVKYFSRFLDGFVHVTAFHAGDLAFAPILSIGGIQPGTGGIGAEATFQEAGSWRVFVQFELGTQVYTAPFTFDVPAAG